VEGTKNELAQRGYSGDKKRGLAQIEYGLLTGQAGRPVVIEVFAGNTADSTAFIAVVESVRARFYLSHLTMVGDRGMITSARIRALRDDANLGWLTCLRAPQIAQLVADGPLQLSLFDERDLAELTHPNYPNERLIACRNPLLASERTRKRNELLAATEAALAPTDAEAALDGIYVLRTTLREGEMDAPGLVAAYKDLARVERDFRHIKVDDLDLRPIHHRLEARVRSHVFICLLAAYLVWHLREVLAPLIFTYEHPSTRDNPVAPALRSASALKKAATKRNGADEGVRGFRELLDHLGTLTRNTMVVTTDKASSFELLSTPTSTQRRAFELLGVAVPRRLM
jgi:transposase